MLASASETMDSNSEPVLRWHGLKSGALASETRSLDCSVDSSVQDQPHCKEGADSNHLESRLN